MFKASDIKKVTQKLKAGFICASLMQSNTDSASCHPNTGAMEMIGKERIKNDFLTLTG